MSIIYAVFGIFCVVIIVKLSHLSTRLKVLESEIDLLKKKINSQASIITNTEQYRQPEDSQQSQNTVMLKVAENVRQEIMMTESHDVSNWFKENFILKIGVILILAGFGWFVSYAFANNWIGPVGRITLGMVAGSLIAIFGTIRLGKNKIQGVTFTILGSALFVISVLAGQYFYSFFSPLSILLMVFLASLYVSLFAVYYSMEDLAVFGLIVSLLAPYLSHTREMDPGLMYFYLFVVSAGMVWVSVSKNWRNTTSIGITGILLYSLPIFWGNSLDASVKYIVLSVSYIISIFYLAVNIYSLIKNKINITGSDIYLTIINTLVIIGFTTTIFDKAYQPLVLVIWALVYAVSGFLVYQKTKNDQIFYIHTLITTLLLAIAASIQYSGNTLVIALAFESAIIAISSYVVTKKIEIARTFALLTILPGILSVPSLLSSKWDTGIMHSDFFVLVVMAFVLASLGVFYMMNKGDEKDEFKVHHMLLIASTFYVYTIIWLSSHTLFGSSDMGVFVSLSVYTVVGLVSHFVGLFKHHIVLKNYGMILLILVVARLVFVDVWNMELTLRITTFIVLGIMFISTAFISKSKKTITPSV